MRYLSVCSGIEAASVAWHGLGWTPAGFSEIEKFPSAVLAHHYPDVRNLGDMTKFKEWPDDLAPNVLVGGTPCQSFSVAGLRKGLADPRGNLALTYLALADRYRPEWLVWENVPGVLSSGSGRDFGSFLGGLGQLGYGFAYRVLDAQFFGVAQRRRRVFVVANARDWRRAAAVLFERESLRGDPAPRRETRQGTAVGALTGTSPGGGWRPGADEAAAGQLIPSGIVSSIDASLGRLQGCSGQDARHGHSHLVPLAYGGNNTAGPIDVATACNASASGRLDFESETFIADTLRSHPRPGSNSVGAIVFDTTQITHPDNRSNPQPGAPCHPLAAGAHAPAIAFDCKTSGQSGFGVGEIASTMRAMGHADSHQNGGGHQAVAQGMAVRRVTPRECERLQGFHDDYTDIPWRTWQESQRRGSSYESLLLSRGMTLRGPNVEDCPDGPRYKALGNSMAVPVMAWIGKRIQQVSEQ